MLALHWKNWITVSELSEMLDLTNRRVQQIIKFYRELGIIEESVLVKFPYDLIDGSVKDRSSHAAPIYKCKYGSGFDLDETKTEEEN